MNHEQPTGVKVPADEAEINYRILAPVCLVLLAGMMRLIALQPFLPKIADDLGSTVPLIGQIATITLLTTAVFSLFTGPVADHYGRRRIILLGQTMLVISTLLLAVAPTYWMLVVAAIAGGIGGAMNQGIAFGVVVASFQGDTMRRALSYAQASATSAAVLGIPLLTLVGALTNWRIAMLTLTGILLFGLMLATIGLPRDSEMPEGPFSPKAILDAYRPLVRSRPMIRIYSAHALRAVGFIGPAIYFASYLQEERGVALSYIGLVMMAAGTGVFLGNIAAGSWLARFDVAALFSASTALVGLGWMLIYLAPVSVIVAVALLAVVTFLGGVGFTSLLTMVGSTTPAGKATTMSLNQTIFTAATAVAALAGGLLIAVFGYASLGVVFPVFAVAAALLIWQPVVVVRGQFAPSRELDPGD